MHRLVTACHVAVGGGGRGVTLVSVGLILSIVVVFLLAVVDLVVVMCLLVVWAVVVKVLYCTVLVCVFNVVPAISLPYCLAPATIWKRQKSVIITPI